MKPQKIKKSEQDLLMSINRLKNQIEEYEVAGKNKVALNKRLAKLRKELKNGLV